jgi:hypothetical protein
MTTKFEFQAAPSAYLATLGLALVSIFFESRLWLHGVSESSASLSRFRHNLAACVRCGCPLGVRIHPCGHRLYSDVGDDDGHDNERSSC